MGLTLVIGNFTATARDDGLVFVEVKDNNGVNVVNWTMDPDTVDRFAAILSKKARIARKIGPR
ncbi:hypothetical protein MMRN_38680 [Mycobacterium marinum]|uniref:hypothetical protein n=1 Tax=Mycobacterium marinum TaxID=1781 RepID=UPI000DC722FE|nr:hypothetical protein [Mycobacterium marinum]AXN50964.1 hypothetical protein CCUG20998_03562 [Mycobacterium marinum]RFZ25439.1 hypothetical protein DSM43519_01625 [Mycobacterium marinum]RFZ28325.1 hypothetical protein DSM44344_01370 [Mycobacterium marinum]RFZ33847.1 hypothetical protein NCTC2275_02693 [Mycobacterium marinum]WOR03011.1 hypothetical protein QDR78_17515 [Mycobacterium marinum]